MMRLTGVLVGLLNFDLSGDLTTCGEALQREGGTVPSGMHVRCSVR